jgi:glycosyltransferase involved in cell wall biosynthesis
VPNLVPGPTPVPVPVPVPMPTLSVVIPCRDDVGPLARCLAALARQDTPALEVIVVDNASRDASAAVARRFGARVVSEPQVGIAGAAATGYDAARGEVLVRCDADSLPRPDWLGRIAAHFAADPGLCGLTGPGRFYGLPRPLAACAGLLYMRAYFVAMGAAVGQWPLFGSNMAMRATAWAEVRGGVRRADPHVHDDVELSFLFGGHRRIRYDGTLRVGISPRALRGAGNAARRLHRAFHTIGIHWRVAPPWLRWRHALAARRRSAATPPPPPHGGIRPPHAAG